MTLLDAPVLNEARERRSRAIWYGSAVALFVLLTGWWLMAGRPIDLPWNWNNHLFGRMTVNEFFLTVEKNDMTTAYGIWIHDKEWQKHEAKFKSYPYERFLADLGYAGQRESLDKNLARKLAEEYGKAVDDKDWYKHQESLHIYPFDRFQKDWSAESPDNEYGRINNHRIAATRMMSNVLMIGIFVNGRKSKAINLDYDPNDHTLNFSPEDRQFLEGPGGIS